MESNSAISLESQIKRVVGMRVVFCVLFITAFLIALTAYDISQSIKDMKYHVNEIIKPLEDFTIGQIILNNPSALKVKLDSFNRLNNEFTVKWLPVSSQNSNTDYHKITWKIQDAGWEYNYKLGNIAGFQFGYFNISGSIFSSTKLYSDLIIRIMLLVILILSMLIFLFPLAKKIPQKLFLEPVKRFLDLFSNNNNHNIVSPIALPIELEEIELKIRKLLDQEKEYQKSKAAIAIAEMSAQVAHDIRSPLAALNAIVKQTQNIPEKQRIMIRNATKQINDIANNLLVQYRTEKLGQPATNQNTTTPEMISILLDTVVSEKRAQEHAVLVNIEFVVDPDSHGVFAKVNPADFKRVISNLINNAIEALKSGGNITLNLSHANNLIKIDLTDSGSGMPQELIHQIMTGAAVTRKKEGHGIGLASSRQYIQSWGGDLSISSEINIGTTIHITLPLIPPADWFADKLEFTQNSSVIILDDDQSIHDVWQSRIDTEIPNTNLTLNHFYQPQDLLKSPIKAHKYLCDYELLGHSLTGLDVIEQLNLNNKATLVTSRYEDPVIQERCRKIGVKILPKNYAAYVPLIITSITNKLKQEPETTLELASKPKPDLILIDDNQTLTDAWKFTAEFENKNIVVFNSLKEVDDNIHQYSVDSKIYIDSDLGETIRGEDYAKTLYEKGYKHIYLATGYDSSKFDLSKFYWIKNIVSKEPTFD